MTQPLSSPKIMRLIQRIIAACLSVTLLSTQVLFAHLPEKNIWEQRRNSIESQTRLAQLNLPMGPQTNFLPASSMMPSARSSGLVSLLSVDGVVRNIKSGTGSSTVVYVQDVHGQLEAQKNISSMILKVLDFDSNAVVGLEGAAGKIPLAPFRSAAPEINREVGSFFLNTGLITGAEYAGLAAPSVPQMFGIEDMDLYLKNVSAVRAALPRQKEELQKIEQEKFNCEFRRRIFIHR